MRLKRTTGELIKFLEGWPHASCKELNYYFGHKENEWTRIEMKDFSIILPIDKEIVELLFKLKVRISLSKNLMSLFTSDGLVWKQPKNAWYLYRGQKASFKNSLTSVNFNLNK